MHSLKQKIIFLILTCFMFGAVASYDVVNRRFNFFGFEFPKTVGAWSFEETEVIPGGQAVGIKLYTKGLLVVDVASFECPDGRIASPAMDSGLKPGDVILAINGTKILDNDDFASYVEGGAGSAINLTVKRRDTDISMDVTPEIAKGSDVYKIGAWVRDSAAGIGTLSFYRNDNGKFIALGHSILDSDVGLPYQVEKGSIENASVISVVKSEKGSPGELRGIFAGDGTVIGSVEGNGYNGIFGTMKQEYTNKPVKLASKWQIKEGPATIIATVDGNETKEYSAEIQKVIYNSGNTSKSMIIKITDPMLIEKTGGIVQGMSGSPILQDGKLAGAITHVFVNDPTKGYGIFAENMIEATE